MDQRVIELHCIMPLDNIPSVLEHGILSYERATKLSHHSVAMQPVQDKRDQKQVPGGLKLHQYANLYFHARNPMLFKRKNDAANLCILKVSTKVLELPGTVISDQNAASDYARFLHPSQWELLALDDIYALDWRHPDNQIAYWRHKARKCAEVLVEQRIPPQFLIGAYVLSEIASARLRLLGFTLAVQVNPEFFF
jgi:hypothetical protein